MNSKSSLPCIPVEALADASPDTALAMNCDYEDIGYDDTLVLKRPFKSHGCGASFLLEEWLRLPFVGEMKVPSAAYPDNEDEDQPGELRLCTCGSSICVSKIDVYREADGLPRLNVSRDLASRLLDLIFANLSTEVLVGPRYDRTSSGVAYFTADSAVGRFFAKRGWDNVELGADFGQAFVVLVVSLARIWRWHTVNGKPEFRQVDAYRVQEISIG